MFDKTFHALKIRSNILEYALSSCANMAAAASPSYRHEGRVEAFFCRLVGTFGRLFLIFSIDKNTRPVYSCKNPGWIMEKIPLVYSTQ